MLELARRTGDGSWYGRVHIALDQWNRESPGGDGRWRALTLAGEHRFSEAVDLLERLIQQSPDDVALLAQLSDAALERGDFVRAADVLQRAFDHRPSPALYIRGAYLRWLTGDLRGADELQSMAEQSVQAVVDPEVGAFAAAQRGEFEAAAGRVTRAQSAFRAALARVPDSPVAVNGLVAVLASQGRWSEAAERGWTQLRRRPSAGLAWLLEQVELHRSRGAAVRAAAVLEACTALAMAGGRPADREVAMALAESGRNPATALACARGELTVRPDIYTDDAVGWVLFCQGRSVEALLHAARSLRLGTPDPRLTGHLGLILRELGDHGRARPLLLHAHRDGVASSPWARSRIRAALEAPVKR